MKDILINEELLEKIRKFKFIETLNSEETINIVPDVLTHHHLLMYRSIDEVIKQSYIAQNKSLLYKEEWQKLSKNSNYRIYGQAISPFPFVIEGAYHSRISLWTKINSLLHPFEKHTLEGNHNLNSLLDLKPYFKKYAQGFNEGFNDFEKDLITPLLLNLGSPDRESYANEVFKFITTDRSSSPTVTSGNGFLFTINSDIQFEISNGYQDGIFEGYLYRAWSIIFSKNELFTPLFKKYLTTTDIKSDANTKEELSLRQIALMHAYENIPITSENSNFIAKQYGHNSGHSLQLKYNFYYQISNRKGLPPQCTPKKLKNKIKLIESVIKLLPEKCKKKALDEVNILKIRFDTENY